MRIAGAKKKLNPEESEKVLRIQHIFEQAIRVFGSLKEAREWLVSPAIGLEGQRPIDLLDTEPAVLKSVITLARSNTETTGEALPVRFRFRAACSRRV